MATKTLIGEKRKGSLGQDEDWWYLVLEDDGACHVEHEWSYVNPYKNASNSGKKKYSVDEFLASDAGDGVKAELRLALAASGR